MIVQYNQVIYLYYFLT